MSNPTIAEMVKAALIEGGFDGLYNDNGECACELKDLFPCGLEGASECRAGYRKPCDCGDHDFHIGPDRPVWMVNVGLAETEVKR